MVYFTYWLPWEKKVLELTGNKDMDIHGEKADKVLNTWMKDFVLSSKWYNESMNEKMTEIDKIDEAQIYVKFSIGLNDRILKLDENDNMDIDDLNSTEKLICNCISTFIE